MNKTDSKLTHSVWELPIYVLVTIPLLLIGAILWLFGLILRIVVLFRRRTVD